MRTDDDCYSGKCLIAGSNQQKDTPKTTDVHGRPPRCRTVRDDRIRLVGRAIAQCLTRRLEANNKVTDEVVKTVRKVLGGSSDASDADIGQTITDVAIAQECMGDGDAWKFNTTVGQRLFRLRGRNRVQGCVPRRECLQLETAIP